MNAPLPEISLIDISLGRNGLEWVGMQGIDLSVRIDESGYCRQLHAQADIQGNRPAAHIMGIHMSRLYRLLNDTGKPGCFLPRCCMKRCKP